jgi:diguanylate cyclase (GGDEF)-like protein
MFLDLDRFKYVNDTLGHRYGDLLLKEVAKRIRSCLRESDMVCRLGGDEFTLILEGALSHIDAATVARKVLTQVSAPYQLEGKECFVSVSIGIAVYPEGSEDADSLIRNADLAMYRAKSKGRACFEFFTPEFSDAARRRVAIEDALREALDKGGLTLMYQPQLDLRRGRITALEALVRLNHRALGVIPPSEFIPIAEEAGLIHRVGDWVLGQACKEAAGWSDQGLDHLRVGVNVSPRQFQQPDIIETIRQALETTGLAPERLDLELTESHLAGDPDAAAAVLTRLRAMGVGTAIDDFGTGYSSLAVLKRLPVSWLKIDRSFVSGLPNNADDAAIATAIIGLAHSLNLRAIAEGVETEAQFRFLRSRGCDAIQGYLLAEPLNADEIASWFEQIRHDELLRQITAA